MNSDADIQEAVETIRGQSGQLHTGIILGSGLGAAAQTVVDSGGIVIPYRLIPGMPQPRVVGHEGRLVLGVGEYAGVALLQGRVHLYEGHPIASLTFATRMLAALGIQRLIVSNAAGGIQEGFRPGDLMLIDGHWTLCDVQQPSLSEPPRKSAENGCAKNEGASQTFGLPFRSTKQAASIWNSRLLQLAQSVPSELKIHLGCYAMMSGPNYETPAEIRMLRSLGCQAVGMSTIPEAMAAANRGVEVLGISCITNVAAGLSDQILDHNEVAETAGSVQKEFVDWLFAVLNVIRP